MSGFGTEALFRKLALLRRPARPVRPEAHRRRSRLVARGGGSASLRALRRGEWASHMPRCRPISPNTSQRRIKLLLDPFQLLIIVFRPGVQPKGLPADCRRGDRQHDADHHLKLFEPAQLFAGVSARAPVRPREPSLRHTYHRAPHGFCQRVYLRADRHNPGQCATLPPRGEALIAGDHDPSPKSRGGQSACRAGHFRRRTHPTADMGG